MNTKTNVIIFLNEYFTPFNNEKVFLINVSIFFYKQNFSLFWWFLGRYLASSKKVWFSWKDIWIRTFDTQNIRKM